jgi:glycine hydroxymethyltransferase
MPRGAGSLQNKGRLRADRPQTVPPPPGLTDRIVKPPLPHDKASSGLQRLEACLEEHTAYRRSCLNMIASENMASPTVIRLQANELSQRYGDYRGRDPRVRKYLGNQYVVRLEQSVTDLVKDLFGAEYVDLRPLSGHIAGAAVLMALCRSGDTVLELDASAGGHRLAEKLGAARLIDLKVAPLPFDAEHFNIDVDRCRDAMRQLKPRVVILGSSSFLFPHPIAALREIADEMPETHLLYDASHVLGLIAGGCFQKPLDEGAHVVASSTHKTFAGPQGGVVLTNDADLADRIAGAIYPALVTNHHLHRIPSLGAACLEWIKYGAAYATAVIANAQALAREVAARGLPVVGNGGAYTQSHTILIATQRFGRMSELAQRLERACIIVGPSVLPERWGRAGLRIGVQELTRRGMVPADAAPIAELMAAILFERRSPEDCRREVVAIAERLNRCRFALE